MSRPTSPLSDFSSDTESDCSAPDEDYLVDRLKVPPHKLLAESHRINVMYLDMKTKLRVAMEAQAVFEEEEARAKELKEVAREAQEHFMRIKQKVDDAPLGKAALPKELQAEFAAAEKNAFITIGDATNQEETAEREQKVFLKAQHEANKAEAMVGEYDDIMGELNKLNEAEVQRKRKAAISSKNTERLAAKKLERRQQERAEEYRRKVEKSQRKSRKQTDVARELHKTAASRIQHTTKIAQDSKAILEEARQVDHENRVQATLELKANTDNAMNEIKGKNEKKKLNLQKKEIAHQEEFDSLLKMGVNPYVEFKRRDVKKKAAYDEKREKARIASQEADLAEKIVKEDDYNRKKEDEERRHKAFAAAYRDEQGKEIIEARNRSYLMEKTTTGTDLIDPTRRMFKIEPSQVTTIKDASFGLGYNPRKDKNQLQDVIDMMTKKYPDTGLGEFARLVPKKVELELTDGDKIESGAGLDALKSPKQVPPGKDVYINRLSKDAGVNDEIATSSIDVDDDISPSISASVASSRATTPANDKKADASAMTKAFPAPKRSKFEEDALKKAQLRQKTRLLEGTPQVAGGRTFHGQAFVAKPDIILFKDFQVGKVYKKKILLTNVSLTFNSFKILDLSERITDFFDIKYERQGRMSAGMSVTIEITFIPKVDEDIISELSFLCSTSPFSIPIKCLTQKVTPSVSTNVIRFDNLVMGEVKKFPLRIFNNGAKPTKYYFVDPTTNQRIPNYDDEYPSNSDSNSGGGSPAKSESNENDADDSNSHINANEKNSDIVYVKNEEELLKQSADVGASCLEYPEGKTALQFKTIGEIESYNKTTHDIIFAPLSPGYFRQEVIVEFEGTDVRISLTIVATSIKVPIFVEEPVVDMRCCVYDKLYRKKVVVKNRGKISFKVNAVVPPELKGFVEFNPDMGFVQPGVDFDFQMKFRPSPEMIALCGKYAIPGEEIIAVPMLINVPEQALPVNYTLFARMTTGKLSFSQETINYGRCYVTQQCMEIIKMKNLSKLPQKFGFVNLRPEVEVQPNDGFGVLLPLEEKEIKVFFKPKSAIAHDILLTVQTTMNMKSCIRLICQGVETPLRLTHTVLQFSSCCPGDRISTSIFATNTTNVDQTFEFSVPHEKRSYLRISPNVETLPPHESCRLEVEFSPPHDLLEKALKGGDGVELAGEEEEVSARGITTQQDEENNGEEKKSDVSPPVDGAEDDDPVHYSEGEIVESDWKATSGESPAEPWSVHSRWSLPCFVKPSGGESSGDPPPLFVDVNTTLVKRILDIDDDFMSFGQLAVGQVKVLVLRVRNLGSVEAPLTAEGLNSTGPFCIVNALRSIPPNSVLTLSLQFAPQSQGVRSETLVLKCPAVGKSLTITLKGEGVSPVLTVSPPGKIMKTKIGTKASVTMIDKWETSTAGCKHLLAGDTGSAVVTLHNSSVFPLKFVLEPLERAHENFNHKNVFTCIPAEADIQPGEDMTVKILFSPDHERIWPYEQQVKISVPNQTEDHVLHLVGRCWSRQIYCVAALPEDDSPARRNETLEDNFGLPDTLRAVEVEAAEKLNVGRMKRPELLLKFPKKVEGAEDNDIYYKRSVLCGSIALNDPKMGGQGTFEVEFDSVAKELGYFVAIPDKGNCAPGVETEIVFNFKPPVVDTQGGLDVGQWIRIVAKVHCRGGFKKEGEDDVRTYDVILEGYVCI